MEENKKSEEATNNEKPTWLLDEKTTPDADSESLQKKTPYPKSVLFIMGNEFCERFSYYGMKAVLTLFLTSRLKFDDNTATVIYHAFIILCYFTPVFGAIISDSYLGKFKTIFYISIVYVAGNVILAIGALLDAWTAMLALSIIGMILIGFGTGGIKPCVSAFGGDQFAEDQDKQRQQFFSIFYFSINAGSLISTFITPILRADVKCFGEDSCFPLAFGVPAILMIVALVLFVIGKSSYKIYPPEGTVLGRVVKCTFHALGRKINSSEKREHWLDYADDQYEKSLIADVKAVMRVLFMFLPLPLFWALFDQQGSRWTLQANKMDGSFPGTSFTLKPDQIQVVNPLLILAMIPIFETGIYPLFAKCNLLTRPLQRIGLGGLLAAASFVVAGFVQLALEGTMPVPPPVGSSEFSVLNTMPCVMTVHFPDVPYLTEDIEPFSVYHTKINISKIENFHEYKALVTVHKDDKRSDCPSDIVNQSVKINPVSEKAYTLAFGLDKSKVAITQLHESREKPEKGKSDVKFIVDSNHYDGNLTFLVNSVTDGGENYVFNFTFENGVGSTEYQLLEPDSYEMFLADTKNQSQHLKDSSFSFKTRQGGAYSVFIYYNDDKFNSTLISVVEPNSLSMLLQIPQYVVITFGEVMFSVTGLEFSYSQAPASMKAVLQSAWLLTVAFGNVIVVIVAEAQFFEKQSYEFFLFAGLMAVDMIVFMIMSLFYVYVKTQSAENGDKVDSPEKEKKGLENDGYVADTNM